MNGLHAYDGHIHDTNVVQCVKNSNGFSKVVMLAETMNTASVAQSIMAPRGSPAFPNYAGLSNAECWPGTLAVYNLNINLHDDQSFN